MVRILFLAGTLLLPAAASASPIDEELIGIIDLFYDVRFDEALAALEGVENRYPGHPAGAFYRSLVYYQRFLLEDPVNPETLDEFKKHNERCIEAADGLIGLSPVVAHYYLGAAHGFRARVLAARKEYWSALRSARKSVGHVKEVVKIDPERNDVYLGLGMYNYFLSKVPAGAKPFAALLIGHWGDREKGLEQIDRTAQKAGVARWEARSVLATLYSSERERLWDKSDSLLKDLMERYPHNPRYRLRRAYVAQRRGRLEEASALADPEGEWVDRLGPGVKDNARAMARYRMGENLLFSGKLEAAAELFDKVEAGPYPGKLQEWLLIRRGNLLELKGFKEKASAAYRSVKEESAKEAAAQYLRRTFPESPKIFKPVQWPLSDLS